MLAVVPAVLVALLTFVVTYQVGGALLSLVLLPEWCTLPLAVAMAVVAARAAARARQDHGAMACRVALGGIVVGGIGFALGFFGPMILAPSANQGPLLGLFITGPLGFVLGAVGAGLLGAAAPRQPSRTPPPLP